MIYSWKIKKRKRFFFIKNHEHATGSEIKKTTKSILTSISGYSLLLIADAKFVLNMAKQNLQKYNLEHDVPVKFQIFNQSLLSRVTVRRTDKSRINGKQN